jgi:hypothetical protein
MTVTTRKMKAQIATLVKEMTSSSLENSKKKKRKKEVMYMYLMRRLETSLPERM